MATSTALMSLKLLVDSKAERVLFAEANKDVVDFLFSILTLPLATAVKLLGKDSMVGCVGSLYASVDNLNSIYVLPGAAKDALLRPTVLSPAASSFLLDLPGPPSFPAKTFYRCNTSGAQPFGSISFGSSCQSYMTDTSGTACPSCGNQMTTAVQFVGGSQGAQATGANNKGFVQGIATYTVMDDLKVTPMSAISGITLLISSLGVMDMGSLQEKTVQIGYNEGFEILKASLQSNTVLTDVFLGGKKPPCSGSNA